MTSKPILIQGKKFAVTFAEKQFLRPNVVVYDEEVQVFTAENNAKNHKDILLEWLKKQAKVYFFRRVDELAQAYSFEYNRVSIRDQSTRWGSCSSYKNLNFNWRLFLAPNSISDYVIIHELAHTKQMNHSKAFWEIVGNILPDYKARRRWLRENEKLLKDLI